MKILCVIDSLGSGGAQRQVVNIANGLANYHDVKILLYNPGSEFFRQDVSSAVDVFSVERAKAKNGFKFSVLFRLISEFRKFDVVISFLPTANIYCAIARNFAPRVKHIACEMSVTNETESKIRRLLANLANLHSHHVVCNSFTQAEYVSARWGMNDRVSTIWNGCFSSMIEKPVVKVDKVYDFIVLSRVAFPKNGLRLLHGLEVYRQRHGYVPYVAWAGRDDSDVRSRQMKADMNTFLASHPEVNERFEWLGEVSDVVGLLLRTRSLLSVSTHEGVPVAICEAMFFGCNVVASSISDNCIILGDGERGFLCDPLSPESICDAIERNVTCDPEMFVDMIVKSHDFAVKSFSIAQMVNGYNRIVHGVYE